MFKSIDIFIQGLWGRQIDSIIDVKLGDAGVQTYIFEPMAALLAW